MFEDVVLEAGDLIMRQYCHADIDDLVQNINDAMVSRFTLHIPFPYSRDDAVDYLEKNIRWKKDGTICNLAIVKKADNRLIGGIGLLNIDEKFNHAEIGYWIGRKYWGKGIIPICVNELVRFGFEDLGLQRISAVIFSSNHRSRKVLEKCGFTHEGTMRDRYVLDGEVEDGEMYGLTRKDRRSTSIPLV